jgi:hypothetical protein
VIALDPDEPVRLGHCAQPCKFTGRQPPGSACVVKAVAESDHEARLVTAQQDGQAIQRRMGVPGREKLTVPGVGGALLQVKV